MTKKYEKWDEDTSLRHKTFVPIHLLEEKSKIGNLSVRILPLVYRFSSNPISQQWEMIKKRIRFDTHKKQLKSPASLKKENVEVRGDPGV